MAEGNARVTLVATGLNAVAAIVPQIVALLSLDAPRYGQFSMVYLVYAAGASAVYSVIADAWSRTWSGRSPRAGWRHYSSALASFSLLFGLAGLAIGVAVGWGWLEAVLGFLAVTTLVHRTGARYYETRVGDWRHVIGGDAGNVVAAVAAFGLGRLLGWDPTTVTLAVWTAGSVASVALSRPPQLVGSRPLRRWVVVHRRAIRTLLADSLLLDLGAVGTPYLVAPVLGLANFGIYRAVSNVATPVQLVLNPLRPVVTGSSRTRLLSVRVLGSLTAVLVAAGVACYVILIALPALPVRLGVLSDLYLVALPASLFVPANGLSFFLYLVARAHATPKRLFQARVAQTVLAVVCPIAGALGWGLQGAVWGFAGSALLFAVLWWVAAAEPRTPARTS